MLVPVVLLRVVVEDVLDVVVPVFVEVVLVALHVSAGSLTLAGTMFRETDCTNRSFPRIEHDSAMRSTCCMGV